MLEQHLPVNDAYGTLSKRPAHADRAYRRMNCSNGHWKPSDTMCIVSNYHFHLVSENSIEEDWVSEKVYFSLWTGTVPVYIGAPNIDNFIPPQSIIKVTDFPSIPALAAYLRCLVHERPDLYDHYLDWRSRLRGSYYERKMSSVHPFCRACQLVAERDPVLGNVSARIPVPDHAIKPEARGLQAPFPECLR